MASLLAPVLLPVRVVERALGDLRRIAEAVEGLHQVLKPMSDDLDGLRVAFEGSNEELAKLRAALAPELRGVREAAEPLHGELSRQRESIDALDEDVREVAEPLAPAAERVGRLAERLPGPGRKR
jgi:hypothetical protein